MAHLFKRGETYWVAFYLQGKQHRRSLKTKHLATAEARKSKLESALSQSEGDTVIPRTHAKDCTPAEFWKGYCAWAESHKAKTTRNVEAATWSVFLRTMQPRTMGALTPQGAEQFARAMLASGTQPVTVNGHMQRMCAFYNQGAKLHLIGAKNPFAGIQKLPQPKRPPNYLTHDKITSLFATAKTHGPEAELLLALGIYTGMRKNEIVNARWEWFDFDRKVISIVGTKGNSAGVESFAFDPKSRQSRTVPLLDELARVLAPHRRTTGYILFPDKKPGMRYRYEPKELYETLRTEAGIYFAPHMLRHTFISLLLQGGVSIFKAAEWAGHADVKITQSIYAHLAPYDADIEKFWHGGKNSGSDSGSDNEGQSKKEGAGGE